MDGEDGEVEQLFLISVLLLVLNQRCKDVMVQCICGYQVTKCKVEREREAETERHQVLPRSPKASSQGDKFGLLVVVGKSDLRVPEDWRF